MRRSELSDQELEIRKKLTLSINKNVYVSNFESTLI